MPRRGENIRKRSDGRWEGRYIVSRNAEGRAIYRSIYAKSYSEVKQRLAKESINIRKAEKNTGNLTMNAVAEWC